MEAVISLIGWGVIFSAYLINAYGGPVGSETITKIYFLLLAIGLFLVAASKFKSPKYAWVFRSICECCLYNIFDELAGRACILDNWEIVGAIFVFFANYIYSESSNIKKYYRYVRNNK